ncbi:MAG: DUF1501 domain-containing protein [Chlamydiia bacterium]|nr:DUF1501 domain-containing protein [Chlamydiia bacterium]
MKRRDFIKNSALASSLAFIPNILSAFNGLSSKALGGKKLVLIQLAGGNDGLNTVVPYTNEIYYKNRPSIAIRKSDVLKATRSLGFNKELKVFKKLYDKGNLSIINNVGYPFPNRSHFRSTDIWQTASSSDSYLSSGWLGRYIDKYGKIPYSGIELDDSLSLIMKGDNINGIATKDPAVLYRNMQTPYFKKVLKYQDEGNESEDNLGFLYKTMQEAESSANHIYQSTKNIESKVEYPKTPFAKQLKTTAEFINSDVGSKVHFLSLGGFDSHTNQNTTQNRLLGIYNDAMDSFIKDLEQNDTLEDTLIVTFSEFGRRVKQNAAAGTDHGTANNVFIIGSKLKKSGFYNEDPNLSDLDDNGDLKFSVDFRTIYATILDKWLEVDDHEILDNSFGKLKFI